MFAIRTMAELVPDYRHKLDAASIEHTLSLLFAAGGDSRIWPDAATSRNRYGTRTTAAKDEISFASTTASNVSPQGFTAAGHQMKRLFGVDGATTVAVDEWFAEIRSRIGSNIGCDESGIVLAASGTDVELLALGLMLSLSPRPITNILIAPEETGSGVPSAASGRHFSDVTALGHAVRADEMLAGIDPDRVEVQTVAIRNALGQARNPDDVDADVISLAEDALKRDRDVLVHVLDTSKTGLTGVSRQAARYISALAQGRVRVLVDACQFRCSAATLAKDIADGFLVAVTGSKFLAGPPFAGALAIPPALVEELATKQALAPGLSDYTALHDWPARLRGGNDQQFGSHFNLGLGLRWVAALEQLEPLAAIDNAVQRRIKQTFADLVRARAEHIEGVLIHPDDEGDHIVDRGIFPLTMTAEGSGFASLAEAQSIHRALRESDVGPVCHVGQAVDLGARTILRVAASAIDINAVSDRLAGGDTMEKAMRPIANDLDIVFDKWAAVSRGDRGL
jgi:hypothetical protein